MIRRDAELNSKPSFREWASLFSGKFFMMLAVYADESGTHGFVNGKDPFPCVGGWLATTEFWEKFCEDWKAVLNQYGAPYFHFRELNKSARNKKENPYHKWSDERVDDFIHDLAITIARGAFPFGGYVSEMKTGNAYKKAFEVFFDDFRNRMDRDFPSYKGAVSFFFESQKGNKKWTQILNDVHYRCSQKDKRIGTYAFMPKHDPNAIPLQAADLLVYANRQSAERVFQSKHSKDGRILDFILFRNIYVNNPTSEYGKLSEAQWRQAIENYRLDKKTGDLTRLILNMPKKPYSPLDFRKPPYEN